MARQIRVILEDDLDGSTAQETLRFALDGAVYEVDLSAAHADLLRRGLAPFVTAGRRIGRLAVQQHSSRAARATTSRGAPPAASPAAPPAASPAASPAATAPVAGGAPQDLAERRAHNAAMRDWARRAGLEVADRGRISADIEERYRASQASVPAPGPLPAPAQRANVRRRAGTRRMLVG